MESILTSRFILNLRQLDSRDDSDAFGMTSLDIPGLPATSFHRPTQTGRLSALDFGNIGAPLDFDGDPENEDERFHREDEDTSVR